MSSYRGRTGPNFSEYLNSLNNAYDPNSFTDELLDLNQDLSIFTNADFTSMDDNTFNFDLTSEAKAKHLSYDDGMSSAAPAAGLHLQSPSDSIDSMAHGYYTTYNTPIQPAPAPTFAASDASSPAGSVSKHTVRKVDMGPVGLASEESSRFAAEEDKRRRNTAASARFRVKKKQREQALEKNLKDVQDINSKLEAKLSQLEMENKWLKDLITEKNGISSKEEMAAAYLRYRKESEEREVKSEAAHTTGVGTQ